VPVLVLSARDVELEKIEALDRGADDYINKPFAMGELMARLRAALRGRARRYATQGDFRAAELAIDFSTRQVTIFGQEVKLSRREYDLLRTMALHAGKVVTHKQIIASCGAATPRLTRSLSACWWRRSAKRSRKTHPRRDCCSPTPASGIV
jgi:two-component system KDP operon response regulator KdpE